MAFSLSGLNKSVQESGIFQKAKSLVWEEGLDSKAKTTALNNLKSKTDDISGDIALNMKNMSEEEINTSGKIKDAINSMAKDYTNTSDGLDSLSPWKNAKATASQSVNNYASQSTYAKYHLNDEVGNASNYMGEYQGAVKAAKRNLNIDRGLNAAKGYYANPISDGRYGTAATRIGATAVAGIGAGSVVVNSLTDPDTQNY